MTRTNGEYVARGSKVLMLGAIVCASAAALLATGPGTFAQDAAANPTLTPPGEWLLEPVEAPDAVATTAEEMKPYTETIPGTNVTFEMVPIPGGTFTMGSPDDEANRQPCEGPQFTVEVQPFWMGKFEVTWDEYDLWCLGVDKGRRTREGTDPSQWDLMADAITQPTAPYIDLTLGGVREKHPAVCMTQFAAKIYCKWLSAKTGRYYRLPSEAEWEYACRAGTTTAYSFGDDASMLGDYAWYYGNSNTISQAVGQKQPNPWGLYDMHGNVMEWVLDAYTPDGYPVEAGATVSDHVVVPEKTYPRVARGGSFMDDPEGLRSAARVGSTRDWSMLDPQYPQSIWYHTNAWGVGFRVVRPLAPPTAENAAKYDVDPAQVKDYEAYPLERVHG